jgi:hypothetical protein
MHVRTRVLVLTAVILLVAACGSSGKKDVRAEPSESPSFSSTGGPMPTKIPPATGPVRTRGVATILDHGDGPELCLGGVMTSMPPQCGGPAIVNWTWAEHRGDFEDANGVRWGEFGVTGTFDGAAFTVTRAVAADEYDGDQSADPAPDFSTPCPEPEGGWQVLDADKTNDDTVDTVFAAAERLPGYVTSWMDGSRVPKGDDNQNDPELIIVNVQVNGDPATAEKALRQVWGGALCVTRSKAQTQRERARIQAELNHLPGMLSSGAGNDIVDVEVVHDDGSLQAWADAVYGPGLVRISSALIPASG